MVPNSPKNCYINLLVVGLCSTAFFLFYINHETDMDTNVTLSPQEVEMIDKLTQETLWGVLQEEEYDLIASIRAKLNLDGDEAVFDIR